ncbi:shikimate kinase [Marinobacter sp. BGYM27]|uniref:shikimate kinase n=1 Tax=unclassified Marinobacter TaxID=83889 RepID=UPI0021A4D247|nr:shikimate kinase [Marinobacter sp. BGYM27]MDG5500186.1 shikimate kinase [Marinobacter sp. BGYM27]
MPGSGKSTVGVLLAKRIARNFVDTDLLIQAAEGRSLQEIVNSEGYAALRGIEERVLCEVELDHHVIATGGSAVYSDKAMRHLNARGQVVFLNVTLDTVKTRIGDFSLRGISKRPDQTLDDLFDERYALYTRYADITIDCDRLSHDQACDEIEAALKRVADANNRSDKDNSQ